MRRHLLACGAVLAGFVCFAGTPAGAATSGPIQVLGAVGNGPVIVTGVIADHGKSVTVTASGKPNPNGQGYHLFKLKKGTILVDTRQLGGAIRGPSAFNATTCSGVLTATAPVPIVKGTKAYANITGSMNMTFMINAILPTPGGKCISASGTGSPVTEVGFIYGSGNVSY